MDSIKVELSFDGDLIGIRTYDRTHGARGRFLIARHLMIDAMLDSERKVFLEKDCGSFAEIWREEGDLAVRLTWLSCASTREVWGFRQLIIIPRRLLKPLFTEPGRYRYLCRPKRQPAKIISEPAAQTVRLLLADKRKRRAFSKAMRDCFRWPGEVVTLYNDGAYSFYYVTKSGVPKNGGLILSHGTLKNGYPYFRYSVHT